MKTDKVAERINALIEVSDKSRKQIAEEVGYDKPNIITMFRTGASKVPLRKLGQLAVALNADPVHMVRLGLETYYPETYEAIREYLGEMVSQNEIELLRLHRQATKGTDPKLDSAQKAAILKILESKKT